MCKGLDDLIAEGKQEGIIEGKQEGIIVGKQAGMNEAIKRLDRNGFDVSTISKSLNLDIDYVKSVLAK